MFNVQSSSSSNSKEKPSCIIVKDWEDSVTHIITAASSANNYTLPCRTMKYFQGLLAGVHIVGIDWAVECLQQQKHLKEDEYYVRSDNKLTEARYRGGVKRARANGPIFQDCHFILHAPFSKPALQQDVIVLLEKGGAKIHHEFPALPSLTHSKQEHDALYDHSDEESIHSPKCSPSPSQSRGRTRGGISSQLSPYRRSLERGKWYFLIDDQPIKKKYPGQDSKQLFVGDGFVPTHIIEMTRKLNISMVSVSWLFDCISTYQILDTPQIVQEK